MIEFLQGLSIWEWLTLGIFLLVMEVVFAGVGFLLWFGLAAIAAGLLALAGFHWSVQLIGFAVLSVASAVLWTQHQRRKALVDAGKPQLNNRMAEFMGREFELHEPIVQGRGKIRVADSVWIVRGSDMEKGDRVRVIGINGTILQVAPAQPSQG